MGKQLTTAPLKAYEVRCRGWLCGIFVGRTPGQARAQWALGDGRDSAGKHFAGLRSRRIHGDQAQRAIERHEDAGKYWRDTKAYARQLAEAAAFNALWPVGTPVQIVNCCESSQWPDGVTWTRTPAWAPGENYCFVSVEGQAGGMDITKVVPLVEPQPCP